MPETWTWPQKEGEKKQSSFPQCVPLNLTWVNVSLRQNQGLDAVLPAHLWETLSHRQVPMPWGACLMLLKAFSEFIYLLTMESYELPSLFAHCGLLFLVKVCWDEKMLGTSTSPLLPSPSQCGLFPSSIPWELGGHTSSRLTFECRLKS